MICKKCGRVIGDEAKFCMYCGTPVINDDYTETQEDLNNEPDSMMIQDDYLNSHLENNESINRRPGQKNTRLNRILWIGLAAVLVLGVIVNHSSASDTKELTVDETEEPIESENPDLSLVEPDSLTQANNIMNGGRMAVGYNHFFYINGDGNIVQSNLDSSDPIIIVNDVCRYLNIYNNTLIYTDSNYYIHEFDLYKGYDKTLLETACYYVTVYDDCIYYQNDPDGESIYCYNIVEDTNISINEEQSYNIFVQDNFLYYSTTEAIYRINLDTKETEKLVDGHAISYTLYNENTIFYLDSEDLYLHYYNLETNENTVLFDVTLYEYIYNDDRIYFRASSDYNNVLGYYDLTSMETYSFGVQGQYLQSTGQYLIYYDANEEPYIIDILNNTNTQLDSGSAGQTL